VSSPPGSAASGPVNIRAQYAILKFRTIAASPRESLSKYRPASAEAYDVCGDGKRWPKRETPREVSPAFRKRLDAIFREWRIPFAKCIAEAQAAGEIDSHFDATELAEFLLASCEGVILRMRVERGPAALERFKKIMFETVFKEQK
jgi:hypothetical protein